MTQKRGSFSGKLGFIAAAAGSAVGLGNIWRFPYVTGENGGAVFLLVFIICAFVICFPIMLSEIALGRKSQRNAYGAYTRIGGKPWGIIGLIGILCGFMILSFYNVVAGWSFGYFLQFVTGSLQGKEDLEGFFISYTQNFGDNLFYSLFFMAATAGVVAFGVRQGIERMAKILMPMLVGLLLFLIIYALTLDGAMEGVTFYLQPDFSALTVRTIYDAMSQAFFSLSLGLAALITYGSYLRKQDSIIGSATMVTGADVMIAFMAGLMIFPLVFSQGMEPTAGPGLVFVSLPGIFDAMDPFAGRFLGASFFLLLCFAALTSTISLLEIPVAYLVDEKNWPRQAVALSVGAVIFIVGIPSMLSTGGAQWATEFISYGGQTHSFFDLLEDLFNRLGLPLGGFLISVFTAWRWKTENLSKELGSSTYWYRGSLLEKFVNLMITVFCPLIIGVVFVLTFLEIFFGVVVF
jgi:neurotransmitter:Na+ symporter, NSS family